MTDLHVRRLSVRRRTAATACALGLLPTGAVSRAQAVCARQPVTDMTCADVESATDSTAVTADAYPETFAVSGTGIRTVLVAQPRLAGESAAQRSGAAPAVEQAKAGCADARR